jgi:hypothetical protein
MDSHSVFPLNSVVTVHTLGKDWPRLGRHVPPNVRKQKHNAEAQGEGDQSTDEPDQEERKKEKGQDGTTKDHPEGFEITI